MQKDNTAQEFEMEFKSYLRDYNWNSNLCRSCGNEFYSKDPTDVCSNYRCQKGYSFLSFSRKKDYTTLDDLVQKTDNFFKNKRYARVEAQSIINKYAPSDEQLQRRNSLEEPLFITAGVQALDKFFYENEDPPKMAFFIAQPSIRTQFMKYVGEIEGFSTSFVNICTEEANASVDEHIKHIDNWLNHLSHLGIFVNDMSLTKKYHLSKWGRRESKSIIINFDYGGLQLGDAGYHYDICQAGKESNIRTISDIGFGLERVCWALNKTPSYFDSIGPFVDSFQNKCKVMDSVRTITLMAASGVNASHSGRGYRFRQFAKKVIDVYQGNRFDHLIPFYYNFWSKFIVPEKPLNYCIEKIQRECERNFNIKIANLLNITSVRYDQTTEDFILSLIKGNYGLDENKIKDLVKLYFKSY
jgi:hypothetical protein